VFNPIPDNPILTVLLFHNFSPFPGHKSTQVWHIFLIVMKFSVHYITEELKTSQCCHHVCT
jgi:hypothetical protein